MPCFSFSFRKKDLKHVPMWYMNIKNVSIDCNPPTIFCCFGLNQDQNYQKFVIYEILFLQTFVYFSFCLIKNRANCSKQSASPSSKLFRTRLKKINVFHKIINKKSKTNKPRIFLQFRYHECVMEYVFTCKSCKVFCLREKKSCFPLFLKTSRLEKRQEKLG